MLESVRQYLQDWSDACEYANECAPDLSVLGNGEPFTALMFIVAVCALAYGVNEARIRRRAPFGAGAADGLKRTVEKMRDGAPATEKLAA
jgi:hypothetical protein